VNDEWLKQIYEKDSPALLSLILRETGGDREWAKDVVQETVIRAWSNAHRIDPDRPLQPWLLTVARRIVIDARRQRGARPPEVDATPLDYLPTTDHTEPALAAMLIRDAFRALTPTHREVLFEVYFRGHTVAEAAQILAIPAGTARSRLYYAMRALRNALEERGLATTA
jgi:RNA polymerase sigma-70 factor (ECF subfamily)